MAAVVPAVPRFQFESSTGTPLANGTVDVYLAGTTTRSNTWSDSAQTVLNTNPIVLNSRGEATIYLDPALTYKFVLKNAAGAEQWTQDNIIGTGSLTSLSFLQSGTSAVARAAQDKLRGIEKSVEDFYATGMADYTLAIQRCINAVGANGVVKFETAGPYAISSAGTVAIQISARNVTLKGTGLTALQFSGTGVAIGLGEDNAGNWDDANYDGVAQGFTLEGIDLKCVNDGTASKPRTALLNSITSQFYGTGTYGIRDWRGGKTRLKNATIQNFEYGYWGVQADLNFFQDITLAYNSVAVYLGARCDQARIDHIWSFGNDTVWLFEGARNALVTHWTTDTDGSGTTGPCIIRNSSTARNARYATTRIQTGNVVEAPWTEQQGSFGTTNPGYDVTAIFELGIGDATQGGAVVIRSPFVAVYLYSDANPHFLYLVNAGNVKSVAVEDLAGAPGVTPWGNMRAVFRVDAGPATPARLFFSDADVASGSRLIESYSASTVSLQFRSEGFGLTYLVNSVGGTGTVLMGGLGLQRLLTHNNTPPSSGVNGDVVFNRTFSGPKSIGWAYTGSAAVVLHSPTTSTDRGNADRTLTPETDHEEQIYTTALTADRNCTLAAPPASAIGYRFRVARPAGGAFNLNVTNLTSGGTLLKAMPAGSWAEFIYDGTNWSLRAYGAL